jgi:two-component system, response regulator / RNA-binding antiterminator
MTGRILTNFRGRRALLLLPIGRDCDTLGSVLERLGMHLSVLTPDHWSGEIATGFDLIFIDGDEGGDLLWSSEERPDVTVVALIGSEAPSRLARLIQHSCDSHIVKPVRSSGVYPALLLASHAREEKRRTLREIETYRLRIAGRRQVMQAVLVMMGEDGLDENTAYEVLRQASMNERTSIDEIARRRLERLGPLEKPDRRSQLG